MNDFESQLRALKPQALPPALQQRLAAPPVLAAPTILRFRWLAWTGAAAALVLALGYLFRPATTIHQPGIVSATSRESTVTSVIPVSLLTDTANRRWRLVEVSWVESDTVVSSSRPIAMQLQQDHRALIPVAIQYD